MVATASTTAASSTAPATGAQTFNPITNKWSAFNPSTPPAQPVSAISTEQGQSVLQKTMLQATKLSGGTPPAPGAPGSTTNGGPDAQQNTVTGTAIAPAPATTSQPTPTKITLINPHTEQTVTFNDAAIKKDNIQQYLDNGYKLSDASGTLPDWLTPTGTSGSTSVTGSTTPTGNTEIDAANKSVAQAKSDLADVTSKLSTFNVSNDPQLAALLTNITAQWDQRITTMQNGENSRIAALTATGIRLGSQYTGGAGGMTGSIISAEEKNAVDQISSLETQKQSALLAAQTAFQTQKWTQYNTEVQNAQKAYDSQLTALKDLQTAQATQSNALKTQQEGAMRDANISKLYASGTTSAADILKALQSQGDKTTTLPQIEASLKALAPTTTAADTLKFSAGQLGKLYGAGMSLPQVQALSDYYNGKGDASALTGLSKEQQTIVHDALNGLSTKDPTSKASGGAKSYSSGSYTYTADDLGKVSSWINQTKGTDGYVDPNAYRSAFDAWTQDGGLAKDFLKNFPPKSLINPTNDWLPQYLKSKTTTSSSSGRTV